MALAPLTQGEARFDVAEDELRRARLVIGPTIPKERSIHEPTLETLRKLRAQEPVWRYEKGKATYDIGPIAEIFWKWWLWCQCPVRGRVMKPVWTGGVYLELPVCNARVHICEVDRFPIIIWKLPDYEIWRLRDEFLDVIRWPIPIPDPEPDPWPIDPGFIDPVPPGITLDAGRSALRNRLNLVALNPQPEPPMYIGTRLTRTAMLKDSPAILDQLEPKAKLAITSSSVATVRQALIDHADLLIPWLCHWRWLWPYFYSCDEVAVVTTDSHGRFEADVWYLCAGDHPDLYFWVEASIGGAWETVYRPPIACYTFWNYICGSDITIRVTDPRVTGCVDVPVVIGKKIVVKTIGRNISMGEILKVGSGTEEGLSIPTMVGGPPGKPSPFGGSLEPRVDFGDGITPAIATHYRWSYRKLGSVSDSDWKVLDRPVNRHYEEPTPPFSPPIYKSAIIGPDPAVIGLYFKIRPDLPAGVLDPEVLDERYDLASAYFDTHLLPDAEQGIKYELKLELFKPAGGAMQRVDLTAAGIELWEMTSEAPLSAPTYVTTAPPADRIMTVPGVPGPHTVAYRLVLHVDNRPCSGSVQEEKLTGGVGAGACGFLEYVAGNEVTLSFSATHPGDFAWFEFWTVRVATGLPSGSASGYVDVSSANGFNQISGVFSKPIGVATLLNEGVVAPEVACTRAAFAERLYVYALATDGYWRLSGLDAPRPGQVGTRAFAITPA